LKGELLNQQTPYKFGKYDKISLWQGGGSIKAG